MGVIADFIIANEHEALQYSDTQSGITSSDRLEYKGLTCVELSTLLSILNGQEWEERSLGLFPSIGNEDSGLTKVPTELLSRLTDFDYDLEQVAVEWAQTEELQCEPDEARSMIDDLAQLAMRADRLKKPVFLWNSP